jgi:branched-chain amino acid aminotransferase
VIQVARDFGMEVEERQLSIKELTEGITSGKVQEAFGAGTAAVIAPISTIGYDGIDYELPERPADAFSKRVFTEIDNIKTGKIADTRGWVMTI